MPLKLQPFARCALLAAILIGGMSQSYARDANFADGDISDMTLEQIDKTARAALPRGTPLSKINEYFASNHIEHSYYKKTNQVFAMIHDIRGGFFPVSKNAQIIVTLDAAGNLAGLQVKAVLTGP